MGYARNTTQKKENNIHTKKEKICKMGKLTQWIAYINGNLSYRAQEFNLTHFTVDATAKKVRKLLKQKNEKTDLKT